MAINFSVPFETISPASPAVFLQFIQQPVDEIVITFAAVTFVIEPLFCLHPQPDTGNVIITHALPRI
jgi:hypothetical protein